MKVKETIRCNNCDTIYFEYDNQYVFECSKCKTDDYLMDITQV